MASARRLREGGISRHALATALDRGSVLRVARGVYACPHLDRDVMESLRAGCAIDCVSALRRNGVWAGDDRTLHLRALPHQHVRPTRSIVHWAAQFGTAHFEVSPIDALLQSMRCLDPYNALASVESAIHTGYFREFDRLRRYAPDFMAPVLNRINIAESGYETVVRLLLEDAGHRVRPQVQLGPWRLDLLVDECVDVEVDGREWHADTFVRDRSKDIDVEAEGIRVLRIGVTHIVDSWPKTLAAIERMIADAR